MEKFGIEKVTFFGINLVKRYLLILVLAKSGSVIVSSFFQIFSALHEYH